ncbi:hypothetical protein DY000_02041492 [Brassica cretica]|uniref:Replication factor A C-terminal domain-containing protein n=1 Tax=Brassica cretica TaxID=69181 RepID=A0ABQ7B5F5_BRACR|nr:hypothetical protein DY000_02041492 [Brassica cretica]
MLKPKQEFFAKSASQIINEQRGTARMAMTRRVHPLLSLNPYQGSWIIKVRVTNKGVLRTYKIARGEGCVFNVELTDEGTEIQEPMFNAAARKSYDTFHKGKNDYEMTLNEYEAGSEEMFITETKINFVPIDELLVRAVSYVELLLSLNTVFRMIISHLNATDLGQQLLDMADKYPVIANKSLKVGDFKVFHYPLSKAAKLKSWYDSEGIETYMSAIVSGMSPSANNRSSTRAYISFIKPPDQEGEANEFQTKLKEATWSSHLFRVSVSQQEYNSEKRQRITVFHYPLSKAAKLKSWYDSEGIETYMSAIVSGMSPSANNRSSTRAYISFIKPPDQEGEANEFQTKLKEATWSSHLFRVSVSQQEYNSEKRQRITVRRVCPIDFAAKTRLLLQDVSKNKKTSQ